LIFLGFKSFGSAIPPKQVEKDYYAILNLPAYATQE